MPNYQGVCRFKQYQAKGDNNWNPPLAGDMGLFARSATTDIDFVNIASDGNAQDFGDHSNDAGNTRAAGVAEQSFVLNILPATNVVGSVKYIKVTPQTLAMFQLQDIAEHLCCLIKLVLYLQGYKVMIVVTVML